MKSKWMNLIKSYIISDGTEINSFKEAIRILENNNFGNDVIQELLVKSIKTLYEIAEKNNLHLFNEMFTKGEIVNNIKKIHSNNYQIEALFLQIVYMFFCFAFKSRGGRFTIEFISYKKNMTSEEYIKELNIQENNIYMFIECIIWIKDIDLMKKGISFLIVTLESIRAIYLELNQNSEAIKLYDNLEEWLDEKDTCEQDWRNFSYIYTFTGKAEVYAKIEDFVKAEKEYSQVLDYIEKLEKNDDVYSILINIYANLANIEKVKRDYEKSLDYNNLVIKTLKLLAQKDNTKYKFLNARTIHLTGSLNFELREHHKAERYFLDSYVKFKEILIEKNPIIRENFIRLCIDRANNFHKLHEIQHSIDLLKKTLDDLEQLEKYKISNIDSLKLQIMGQLSYFYQKQNMHNEAKETLKQWEKILEKQEKNKTIMGTRIYETYRHLGIQYREYNPEKSKEILNKAIDIFENKTSEKNKPAIFEHYIATLHEMGTSYKEEQDYSNAESFYEKAIKLQEKVIIRKPIAILDLGLYLNNLGILSIILKKFGNAKIALNYSLRIRDFLLKKSKSLSFDGFPERARVIDFSMINNDLGCLYMEIGDFDIAANYMYIALLNIKHILKNENSTSFENEIQANILANLSRANMNLGNIDFAEKNIIEALKIRKNLFKTHPDKFITKLISDFHLIGLTKIINGKEKESESCYLDALEILNTCEEISEEIKSQFILEIQKDIEMIESITNFRDLLKGKLKSNYSEKIRNIILAKSDSYRKKSKIEEHILKELESFTETSEINLQTVYNIFHYLELSQFNYYPFRYELTQAQKNITKFNLSLIFNDLKEKSIDRYDLIKKLVDYDTKELRNFVFDLKKLNELEIDCLEMQVNLLYILKKPFENQSDLTKITDYLGKQTNECILIISNIREKCLFLLLVKDKFILELTSPDFIYLCWELSNEYIKYNGNVDNISNRIKISSKIAKLGSKLWEKFPESIRNELLNYESIVLSLSKDIEMTPFELLKDTDQYIGLTKIITRAFSPFDYVSNKLNTSSRTEKKFKKVLIIAEPRKNGEKYLEMANNEADTLTKLVYEFSNKFNFDITRFNEKETNKADIISSFLESSYSIIHFINHGEFNKIFISNNDDLNSHDFIENYIWLGDPIIFLNVCNIGKFVYYDDMILKGFIPELNMISSGPIIASQNRIEDMCAYILSIEFYNSLFKGINIGISLKLARNYSFKNCKDHDKLEWANFLLFGDSEFRLVI